MLQLDSVCYKVDLVKIINPVAKIGLIFVICEFDNKNKDWAIVKE